MNKTIIDLKDFNEVCKEKKITAEELTKIIMFVYPPNHQHGLITVSKNQMEDFVDRYREQPKK